MEENIITTKGIMVNQIFYEKDGIKVIVNEKTAEITYPDGKLKEIPVLNRHKYLLNLKDKGYKKNTTKIESTSKRSKIDSDSLIGQVFKSNNCGDFVVLSVRKDLNGYELFTIKFIRTCYSIEVRKSQLLKKSIRDKSLKTK